MRFLILSCLSLLAVSPNAEASDLYSAINRLRAGGGNCPVAKNLPPLKPNAVLERVARDMSRGNNLPQSLQAAGYRATKYAALSISGDGAGAWAENILARPDHCQDLQDPAMAEIGLYREPRQVWIVTAAPFAPSVGMSEQTAALRVLELVNQARATPRYCGNREVKPARRLLWNEALARAAQLHARDMARNNYFSHAGRDGSGPAQRAERVGYRFRTVGENIAAGQMKPEDVVAGWLKSPEHCANVMNPAFTEMGVAFAVDPDSKMGVYWTQTFGTPR